jgi:hypothetical protein
MRPLLLLIPLLLVLNVAALGAAPPRPRPYSGCGVLALTGEPWAAKVPLVLYQEPGVLRVAELERGALPRLAGSEAEPLVAVSARKGEWTRLAYDDAGREGWLREPRAWRYLPWQEFLPGRRVRILPGMKKGFYALRSEPREAAPETAALSRDQEVRLLRVQGDWASLEAPAGWFRWRDPDGRLTISLQDTDLTEKR